MLKLALIVVVWAVLMGLLMYTRVDIFAEDVNSFDECVVTTNLVYTSYPTKCVASDGSVFTNPIAIFDEEVIEELKPGK